MILLDKSTVGLWWCTTYQQCYWSIIEFVSIIIEADESVKETMHILTEAEKEIGELQVPQAEQDEAIAAMMFEDEPS